MKKYTNKLNQITHSVVAKAAATAKVGTGVTGEVVATGITVIGGLIAVSGALVAAIGVAAYNGGNKVMQAASRLDAKSTEMVDEGMHDLRKRRDGVIDAETVPNAPEFGEAATA